MVQLLVLYTDPEGHNTHSATDGQTDRQTTLWCQWPIILYDRLKTKQWKFDANAKALPFYFWIRNWSKYRAFVERINNVSNALKYSAGTSVNMHSNCVDTSVADVPPLLYSTFSVAIKLSKPCLLVTWPRKLSCLWRIVISARCIHLLLSVYLQLTSTFPLRICQGQMSVSRLSCLFVVQQIHNKLKRWSLGLRGER